MANTDVYVGLVPAFNATREKFIATIRAITGPFADQQEFLDSLIREFDLDTATGVQLDAVGKWVGRSRVVSVPLQAVYFSLDTPHLGFDEAVWKGPHDSLFGLTSLDDFYYRMLLRAKIAANSWDGTVPGAAAALRNLFAEATSLPPTSLSTESGNSITTESGDIILLDPPGFSGFFIDDRHDMSVVFGMVGRLPGAVFVALFAGGYIPVKPEGVQAHYRFVSVDGSPMFGFDVHNQYLGGFNTGSWGIDQIALLEA